MNNSNLSSKQALVHQALSEHGKPITAYKLLDKLKDQGFNAPPQIYRALDKLVVLGLAHKLESINAYITCHDPSCNAHSTHAFAICEDCGKVEELCDHSFSHAVEKLATKNKFSPQQANIELRGQCEDCS